MCSKPNHLLIAIHGALATGLCLGGAAAFPFGLSRVVGDVMGLRFQFDPPPLIVTGMIVIVLSVLLIAGAVWGFWLSRITHYPRARRFAWAGALSFGVGTLTVGLLLLPLRGLVVQVWRGLPIHLNFTLLFIVGVFIVTAITGAALGIALQSWQASVRLACVSAIVAVLAFGVVDLILDRLGLRVGTGNGAMVKVAALSNLSAALAGGAAMSVILAREVGRVGGKR